MNPALCRRLLPVACLFSAGAFAETGTDRWFGERLVNVAATDLKTPAYTEPPSPDPSAPSARRIPPAPFDSPPFPSAEWQIGGTPTIGDPGNIAPWPLMEAIYAGPDAEAWRKSRIQIYG